MTSSKNFPWKQLLTIAVLGIGVFIVVEIYKVFAAGERNLKAILFAPFTALGKVWTSITSLFSSSYKPGTVAGTGQTPSQLVGVDPNSPLGSMLDSQAGADNLALLSGISDNSSSLPVVGVWSQP